MSDQRRTKIMESLSAGCKMNRRDFIKNATALGLTISSASALWSNIANAQPKQGGHLRIGTDGGATSDTFNPLQAIGTEHVTQAIFSCYDTLTEVDANGEAVPSLSESWEISEDGKTWIFNLRKDVEFHNGKTLTANDVIWSLQQHLNENNSFADGRAIVSNFEQMKADGDTTLVLVQKEVNYDLPAHLTSFGLIIAPEGTEDWDAGIGTGPYVLENYDRGVSFIAKKFANFYRGDQGHFDSIELLNIADIANRTNALRSGAVDVIGEPDTKTAAMLDKLEGFKVLEIPGSQHYTTAMRTDTDPFTDNNIRLAVKYGINRQEIVDKVFGGYGYVGNDHPISKGSEFFNNELPQREYDPDKARYYLDQAGLSGIDLSLSTSDGAFSGAVDSAALMQESMKAAGINVDINRAPADGYWSDIWLKAPWCFVYWNGRPTVDWALSAAYISTSSWNDTYFNSTEFDNILIAARTEKDQAKRKDMYFELQRILHDQGGTTVFAFASFLMGLTDKLGHGDVAADRRMDGNRLARRWWFNS